MKTVSLNKRCFTNALRFVKIGLLLYAFLWTADLHAQVKASFTLTPNNGCTPQYVAITNTSTGTGTLTYQWNFGINTGVNSTLKDPSTTFPSCGNFIVTLIASNGTKTDTARQTVAIYCNPIVGLKYNISSGCPGTCITFTDTSKAGSGTIAKRLWDFGDGTVLDTTASVVTHCYTSSGTFSVSLQITNSFGCVFTQKFNNVVNIYDRPVIAFTPSVQSACSSPFKITYKNSTTNGSSTSGKLKYHWDFGDPGSGTSDTSSSVNPSHTYTTGSYNTTLIVSDANGCIDTLIKKNEISIGSTTLTISPTTDSGCCPLHVNFTSTSTLVPISYSWNFGGAAPTDTSSNPSIVVPCPTVNTTYKVKLTANYAGGCSISANAVIKVFPKVKANFQLTGDTNTCNPPVSIGFKNTSLPISGTTFIWNIGGNNFGTVTPANRTYSGCGGSNVQLIAIGKNGCADTNNRINAVVIKCSKVNFHISAKTTCVGGSVTFVADTFPKFKGKYIWTFGDSTGTTTTSNVVSHTFSKKGCFTISLKVKFDSLCSASITKTDSVCTYYPPTVYFKADPLVSCPQKVVHFTDSIIGLNHPGDSILYVFGDGGTSRVHNPSYQYNDTGFFTVKLKACNYGCCQEVDKVRYIYIYPPIAIPSVPIRCDSPYIRYFDGSKSLGADHYHWYFDDLGSGANDSSQLKYVKHVFPKRGVYKTSLTVYNDSSHCKHTTSVVVNITELHARFTYTPKSACSPVVIKCTNTSQDAIKAHWVVYYDEKNSIVYQSDSLKQLIDTVKLPGHYKVKMVATDINGCKDSIIHDTVVTVYGFIAQFTETPTTACPPFTATFTNTSYSTTSVALRYHWDFGDPLSNSSDSSSLKNPTHVYKSTGCFTVTLKIYDNHGCISTVTNPNVVCVVKPQGDFTVSKQKACAYAPLNFQVTNVGKGVANYSWDFGDPSSGSANTSKLSNPTHRYKGSGSYTVKLVISTSLGCDTTVIKTNYINIVKPHAAFGTKDSTHAVCPPLTVHFKDSSTGKITNWYWNFGDSGTSVLKNAANIYTKSGTFDVSLIVEDSSGCYDTLIRKQYIKIQGPLGNITFTPNRQCAPLRVHFKANASNAKYYIWDFGNTTSGKLLNADTISFVYTQPGVYHPRVILDNGSGCTHSIVCPDSVVVTGFVAAITQTPKNDCPGTTLVYFNDTLLVGAPIISQYWNFGEPKSGTADTSTLAKPTHTFAKQGTYYVKLVASSKFCHDTLYDTVEVHPNFNMNLKILKGSCLGDTTFFYDSSTHPIAITYRHWNFGDNSSATIINPVHDYAKAGIYTVTLTVGDKFGCKDSIQQPVDIYNLPVIKKNNDTAICIHSPLQFSLSGGVRYKWTPSTYLSSDTIANPSSKPLTNTTYSILVTDIHSCKNTAQVKVTINPLPKVIAYPDTTVCYNDTLHFFVKGAKNYVWSPSTYLSSTTIVSPTCIPRSATNYIVSGTDVNGCVNRDTIAIKIYALPTIVAKPDTGVCIGSSARLRVSGAKTYNWSPALHLSNATITNPIASPVTTTTYTVIGKDLNGCINKDSVTVTIYPLPTVKVSKDTAICIYKTAQLVAGGGVKYKWTPNTYLTNDSIANPLTTPTSNISYKVLVTDAHACQNTAKVNITVNPLPTVIAYPDTTVCYNDTLHFFVKGAKTYIWSPSTYLSSTTIVSPTCIPRSATNYIVSGTDVNGCVNRDTIAIKIYALPTIVAKPDTGVCIGSSARLRVSGAKTYNWSPALHLSNATITNPIASPVTTTTYTVIGKDLNGCINKDSVTVTIYPLPTVKVSKDTAICIYKTAQLVAGGGVKYKWTPNTYLTNDSIANPLTTPTSNISYKVLVTDAHACQNTGKVNITVHALPKVKAVPDTIVCYNQPVQFKAIGANTYQWTPATYLNKTNVFNPICNPLVNTSYIVTGTDVNGCINKDTLSINVNPLPVLNDKPDTSICIGDTAHLHVKGALTYIWTPATHLSSTTIYNPVATPTVTTRYYVTGIDGNNCKNYDSVLISIYSLPVIKISNDTLVCPFVKVQLHASGGKKYVWSPNTFLNSDTISNPISSPLPNIKSVSYSILVTDIHTCKSKDSVTISLRPIPPVKATANKLACLHDSMYLNVTGAKTYTWTPGTYLNTTKGNKPLSHPLADITYSVIGVDSNGCYNIDSVHIRVDSLPHFTVNPDTGICVGKSVQLYIVGLKNNTYKWSPATYLSSTVISNPISTPTSSITYNVLATDSNGCRNIDTFSITVYKLPTVGAGGDTVVCMKSPVIIYAANGFNKYLWVPSRYLNNTTIYDPTCTPDSSIIYTVFVTDAHGCINSQSVTIKTLPLPVIKAYPDTTVCITQPVQMQATGAVTYTWQPGYFLSDSTISNPITNPKRNILYYVKGTDAHGCQNIDSVQINIYKLPTVTAKPDTTICVGSSLTLHATGGVNYNWTPSTYLTGANTANPVATPPDTMLFFVTVTDIHGCVNTDSVLVNVVQKIKKSLSKYDTICTGQSVQLFASGSTHYLWKPNYAMNSNTVADPVVSPAITTRYHVTIYDGLCFSDTGSILVLVNQLPNLNIGPHTYTIVAGTDVLIGSYNAIHGTYTWTPSKYLSTPNNMQTLAMPPAEQKYKLSLTDLNGCKASDSLTIFVLCKDAHIFVPDAFAPTNNKYTTFKIHPENIKKLVSLRIFDRWGKLLFETNDLNEGWDGRYNGELLDPGVYVYYINAVCTTDEPIFLKGNITLIR